MFDTKIRILAIAPYARMEMAILRAAQSYPDIDMEVQIGDLEAGAEIVKTLPENAYDCIISRGGTAALIEQITDLPVIEIPLSVYDVLSSIKLAQNYSARYAIVGFPNITETAHTLCNLLEYDLDIVTIHKKEDVPFILNQLKSKGYEMVVCDVITHTLALQNGLNAFLITSGMESIDIAINRARNISRYFSKLRYENTLLRTITQEQNAEIIVMSKDHSLLLSTPNHPAEGLLQTLKKYITQIPKTQSITFYFADEDILYKIIAQHIPWNNVSHCLFYCIPTRIAHNSNWIKGIRSIQQKECEYLLKNSFYSISGAMGMLSDQIQSMTTSRQPVMILGEPGTEKEQIAQYLYYKSSLSHRPLLIINSKLMTEKSWNFLFHHNNSPLNDVNATLYFQHFDQIPLQQMTELSSIIKDTGLIRRIRLIFSVSHSDDRPISETIKDFIRQLGCFSLQLPTLRSRCDEIPSLASIYLNHLNLEYNKQISGLEPYGLNMLCQFNWPYNYTQFKHILQSLATMTDYGYIRSATVAELLGREQDLKPLSKNNPMKKEESKTLEEIISDAIWQAIVENNGNRTAASKQLGISRTTLWRYVNKNES